MQREHCFLIRIKTLTYAHNNFSVLSWNTIVIFFTLKKKNLDINLAYV